jgi:hypothetical protein
MLLLLLLLLLLYGAVSQNAVSLPPIKRNARGPFAAPARSYDCATFTGELCYFPRCSAAKDAPASGYVPCLFIRSVPVL